LIDGYMDYLTLWMCD